MKGTSKCLINQAQITRINHPAVSPVPDLQKAETRIKILLPVPIIANIQKGETYG